MTSLYNNTTLTPMRVARMSGYIDWSSQPSTFKHYPDFLFRYKYGENHNLKIVELSRIVTSSTIIASKPYLKLNTPSAGNLHPIELYVQIRGIKGILSGIYHVDTSLNEIVLIQEINDDGIEKVVNLDKNINGYIFLVSIVPFRSEWKYRDRAFRYCYLDAGHQLNSLQQSANFFGHSTTILSNYDEKILNEIMGFNDEEFTCAVLYVGETTKKETKTLNKPLIQVAPTDYCETGGYVKQTLENSDLNNSIILPEAIEIDENVILNRRSARKFTNYQIDVYKIINFLQITKLSFSFFFLILNSTSHKLGLYLNDALIKEGNFADDISSLLVDQQFVKNANIIIIMTSNNFGEKELVYAGALANQLYLLAEKENIGFTGIGAFYDEKLQNFLSTKNYIHYVCAVGAT